MKDRYRTLFLVGLLIGVLGAPLVLGALQSGDPISGGVSFNSPSNTTLNIEGSTEADLDDPFPDADTVDLPTTDGNITVSSAADTSVNVTASDITGTYTVLREIDTGGGTLTVDVEGKDQVDLAKAIDRFEYRASYGLDDNTIDFKYGASSTAEVTIRGLPADTTIAAVDDSSDALLDAADSDGSGTLTLDSLDSGSHDVVLEDRSASNGPTLDSDSMSPTGEVATEDVQLSIDLDDPDFPSESVDLTWYLDGTQVDQTTETSAGTATTTITGLSDGEYNWSVDAEDSAGLTDSSDTKGFAVAHASPDISDIQPSGDLQADPTQASVNVTDADFGTADDDNVTVTIDVDGSQLTQTTISSDSDVTASLPASATAGGEHTVTVNATDEYGNTVIQSSVYRVPDTLFVRNELDYNDLIPSNGSVRFFGTEQVFNRSTSNGQLDLAGLPVDQNFIVEIEPTNDDYLDREIFIESIYEQNDAYSLNANTTTTIESRFVLDDPTGEYGSESVLKIKRPINISGNVTYQTIVADRFGVEGVTATLQNDTRYRLAVTNGDGDEQTVGPYRAVIGETVEVRPGQPTIELAPTEQGWAADANRANGELEYRYADYTDTTTTLTVYIHERGDPGNLLRANDTYAGLGNASGKIALSPSEQESEWVVNFIIDRQNRDTVVQTIRLGDREDLTPALDGRWRATIGVGALVLLGGAFSVLNAGIGAVIVALVGSVLWFTGWLGGATSAAAVVLALFISILGHIYERGR